MLSDFRKNLLHDDELIGHKRKVCGEIKGRQVPLDIQLRAVEGEQVAQNGVILLINRGQDLFRFIRFLQNTLLDHLINRGRGQGKSGFETSLDTRELISTNLYDLVNGFLTSTNDPNLTLTFTSQLFRQGLQIQEHIRIGANILANLVNHEQQPEVFRFAIHILLDVTNELGNGQFGSSLIMEPLLSIVFGHVQDFHQCRDDKLAVERKRTAGFHPGFPLFLLKNPAEFLGFTALLNVVFQHSHLQVLTIETQVVIEHLRKDSHNSGFVLVDGTFNINIKKDGLGFASGCAVDLHKSSRVICKLLAEHFHGGGVCNTFLLQNIGKHFQKVGFTTSEETRNPNTDISSWNIKRIAIVIEKC